MNEKREPMRLAVFASGKGSNLGAILQHIDAGELDAAVVLVVCNRSSAGALQIAAEHKITGVHLSPAHFSDEATYSEHLLALLREHDIELIALAGYLKKIPLQVVRAYRHRILNIHPALLPSFGGPGLYGSYVHQAVLDHGCKVSGATVHLVDEEYDTGPPLLQECVPVLDDDTVETLAARVLVVEHRIYSQAIQLMAEGRVTVVGRRAIISPH